MKPVCNRTSSFLCSNAWEAKGSLSAISTQCGIGQPNLQWDWRIQIPCCRLPGNDWLEELGLGRTNPISKRLQQQRLLKSTPKVPFRQYQRNVELANPVCDETGEYKFLAVDYRVVIGGLKAGLLQANVAGSWEVTLLVKRGSETPTVRREQKAIDKTRRNDAQGKETWRLLSMSDWKNKKTVSFVAGRDLFCCGCLVLSLNGTDKCSLMSL